MNARRLNMLLLIALLVVVLPLAATARWSVAAPTRDSAGPQSQPGTRPAPLPGSALAPAAVELPPATSQGWWNAVQHDIAASEYAITWQTKTGLRDSRAAYQAPNRAQNLRTYFTPTGIEVLPRTTSQIDWRWGLALAAYGTPAAMQPVARANLAVNQDQVTYSRGPISEWYHNTTAGLKQGFTISTPPHGQPADRIALDLTLSGTLRPVMDEAGIVFETAEGVAVLRYSDLVVFDRNNQTLTARFELLDNGMRLRIVVDAAGAAYPITIDPLTRFTTWSAESNQGFANFGYAVAGAGDLTGDGIDEVIVGAPYFDNGEVDEGRVFVYRGAIGGAVRTAAWTAEINVAGANFGAAVSGAGDVNNDSYADVIIGAPYYANDQEFEGVALVYLGSDSTTLENTPIWRVEGDLENANFGADVAGAGNINNDAYDDLLVGSPSFANGESSEGRVQLFLGGPSGPNTQALWNFESNQISARLGTSVAAAGDVNNDGFDDVIVGAPYYANGESQEGRAYVFIGGQGGPTLNPQWSVEGNQVGATLGVSVGGAGDVNGDGFDDVMIGLPSYDNGQDDEGRVNVYHGSATGVNLDPDWWSESDLAFANRGFVVGSAGDVNGDGFADVVMSEPGYSGGQALEGRLVVYEGSAFGLSRTARWTGETNRENAKMGFAVASAGDVNGDGFDDLIAGAPLYTFGQAQEGQAVIFHGAPAGLRNTPAWTAESEQDGARFGYAVAGAGDVNGDGFNDVVIGAPFYDGGQADEGRAYLFTGARIGLGTAADWSIESNQAGAKLGAAVSGAGDVNNDTFDDLVIGVPYASNGQQFEGQALVFYGRFDILAPTADWSIEGNQANANLGLSLDGAGDVNDDGFDDLLIGAPNYSNGESQEGRVLLFRGTVDGLPITPASTIEINRAFANFGWSVSGAGDVNNDTFDDVIIGAPLLSNDQDQEGRAYIYLGALAGLNSLPTWATESNQAGANLGWSVSGAGDVNKDGFADVLVGIPLWSNEQTNAGAVFGYSGSAEGPNTVPDWRVEGTQEFAKFGWAVSHAGDVNDDGFADVIIGASNFTQSDTSEGRATAYYGSSLGLELNPGWTAQGGQLIANFGYAVAGAGDINGDRVADVVIGAPLYDDSATNEGRAFVFYGLGVAPPTATRTPTRSRTPTASITRTPSRTPTASATPTGQRRIFMPLIQR